MAEPCSIAPDQRAVRAHKAREKAASLYPLETWRAIEERLFIAANREPKGKNQQQVLEKELVQARILTAHGSTVYLLPEITGPTTIGIKHPDAVVDGVIMEFKTITGNSREIEKRLKESRKKAASVFFKITGPLTQEAVLRKLIATVRKKGYRGGMVIAHFTETGKIYFWDIDRLQ